MSELLHLSGAQAAERIRAGEVDAGELFDLYRERAAAEDLNAFLWVRDEGDRPAATADAPLGGVPLGVKDLFCVEGVPSTAASRIL
ncbi:MAG: aspartyl-tRNA(Asn)/glutamyl-tRNA(Gln) amidotransferase subunit, partial [Thermoleophilales bacterium]|nr:aspartyl-tRNA(Asn)/glutamyl-tRNA(Gln) amidotransferase subunit [Thermoleophilales bacterium]